MAAPTADPAASGRVRRWVRRPGRPLVTFLARATAAAGGGVLLYLGFAPRTLWWLALPAFGLLGAAVHGRPRPRRVRATARCSGWASCCRCCAGPASTSARCRGWRSRRAEAVFVGAAGAGMAVVSRLRGAPAVGGGGVGRRGGAARAGAVRRVPVGPGRLRPARRAAAARGRRRRGAAAVVRHRAGRARAGGGRAAPGPAARCGPPSCPRCSPSPRWRPVRWPRCSRPPGSAPVAHGDDRRRAGQRAAARAWTSTPSAGRCSTTTCGSPSSSPRTSPPVAARARTWCCGRRTPPTSTRCATPTPPRRSTRPPAPSACRSCWARCWPAARPDGTPPRRTRCSSGQPGVGVVDRTDKRRVQPFGEYLPWRPFFRLLSELRRPGRELRARARARAPSTRRASGWGSRSAGRSPSTTWSPTASPPARRCWPCRATTPPSAAAT